MTAAEYIRKERKLLTADPSAYIETNSYISHIETSHKNPTDAEILNSIVSGQKFGDSRFTDEETMYQAVSVALFDNMPLIERFVNQPGDFPTDTLSIEYDASNYFDAVGHGFVAQNRRNKPTLVEYGQKIETVTTSAVGLILKRNPDNECGFSIKTAFPAVHPIRLPDECIQRELKDITDILHQTETYKSNMVHPITKIGLEAACNSPKFSGFRVDYRAPMQAGHQPQLFLTTLEAAGRENQDCAMIRCNQKGQIFQQYGTPTFKTISHSRNIHRTFCHDFCDRMDMQKRNPELIQLCDAITDQLDSQSATTIRPHVRFPQKMMAKAPSKPKKYPGLKNIPSETQLDYEEEFS